MVISKTFGAPFLRSSLPPDTNIPNSIISFRVKTTDVENRYEIYSRTFADGSSMLEVVDFTVSYEPVYGIPPLQLIISIVSAEVLIIFLLDISNSFQNTILPNPE